MIADPHTPDFRKMTHRNIIISGMETLGFDYICDYMSRKFRWTDVDTQPSNLNDLLARIDIEKQSAQPGFI